MSEEGRVEETLVWFNGRRSKDGCSAEGYVLSGGGEEGGDLLGGGEGGVGVVGGGRGGEEGSFEDGREIEVDEMGDGELRFRRRGGGGGVGVRVRVGVDGGRVVEEDGGVVEVLEESREAWSSVDEGGFTVELIYEERKRGT